MKKKVTIGLISNYCHVRTVHGTAHASHYKREPGGYLPASHLGHPVQIFLSQYNFNISIFFFLVFNIGPKTRKDSYKL